MGRLQAEEDKRLRLLPGSDKLAFDRKYLPLGGLLSGFFGGLSGHQSALRTVQVIVGVMLILVGLGMIVGLL